MRQSFAIGIGGAAGQGVATPGDIFAKIFSRRGLHLNVYNAYQSIIRGGHTFLTIRTGPDKITNMGDRIDLLIPLNQDTMDRHLSLLSSGGACIYNSDTIKPGQAGGGRPVVPAAGLQAGRHQPQQDSPEHPGHRRRAQHDRRRLSGAGERPHRAIPQEGKGRHR